MSVQVYGCNHVAVEVDDIKKAVAFYKDVFNLEQMRGGEGDAFFKLGEHQFLAIFEVEKVQPSNMRHFGIMVRDEHQLAEVRKKLTGKYKLKLEPPFRCDFRDPWGNRIQVVDLHDETLIWLLPYREAQKAGGKFGATPRTCLPNWNAARFVIGVLTMRRHWRRMRTIARSGWGCAICFRILTQSTTRMNSCSAP